MSGRGARARPRHRAPAGSGGSGARAQGARRGRAVAACAALLLIALASWAWWRTRPSAAHGPRGIVPMPLDSIAVAAGVFESAQSRGDWVEALRWQQRIAAALPRMPIALRQLAETEHNFGTAVPEASGGSRYLIRNSLERARVTMHAIALLDSSVAVADDPREIVQGLYWKGRILERYGLSLEALSGYERALAISPTEPVLLAARDTILRSLGAAAVR